MDEMHLASFPLQMVRVVTVDENWILAVHPDEKEAGKVKMKCPLAPPDHLSVKT